MPSGDTCGLEYRNLNIQRLSQHSTDYKGRADEVLLMSLTRTVLQTGRRRLLLQTIDVINVFYVFFILSTFFI